MGFPNPLLAACPIGLIFWKKYWNFFLNKFKKHAKRKYHK